MYSTINRDFTQVNSFHSSKNCTKFSRCNNPKTCSYCNNEKRKRELKRYFSHLQENHILNYNDRYIVTFTNKDQHGGTRGKNSNIKAFIKEFISKYKRNKNFFINSNNGEFIGSKEISFSKEGGFNPHFHFIILGNDLDFNNIQLQQLLKDHRIDMHKEEIYKDQKENTYLKSLKNIFIYINKFEEQRAELEQYTNISKGEQNTIKSKLFNPNYVYNYNLKIVKKIFTISDYVINFNTVVIPRLYLLISFYFICLIDRLKDDMYKSLYINIIEDHDAKIKAAKQLFKRNISKYKQKGYIRLLKSLRKKIKAAKIQKFKRLRKISRLRSDFSFVSYTRCIPI